MNATAYTVLVLDVRDGVAQITLNRPDAANALNADLFRELNDAVLRCDADPDVRAVIVTGSGRFFSAGGDLKSFSAQAEDLPRHLKEMTLIFHGAISRLNRMDAPVIMAIN